METILDVTQLPESFYIERIKKGRRILILFEDDERGAYLWSFLIKAQIALGGEFDENVYLGSMKDFKKEDFEDIDEIFLDREKDFSGQEIKKEEE